MSIDVQLSLLEREEDNTHTKNALQCFSLHMHSAQFFISMKTEM